MKFNIELMPDELCEAFFEQQHKFDIEDVISYGEAFDSNDFEEYVGCTYSEFLSMKEEIADEMRRNINKYDMDWSYAREEAVREVVSSHKKVTA